MRRLITALLVCAATATATLWWLHGGDLEEAVRPVVAHWDAEGLARNAGFQAEEPTPILPGAEPDTDAN